MTNAEINLRGQKNTAEIARQDRASREAVADKDRAYKKYDTDTRAKTADKDRQQKEKSDARNADVTKRGQNLKVITDATSMAAKGISAGLLAANDPAWWTEGFSAEEQGHVIPTNWKIDAYSSEVGVPITRDILLHVVNTIPVTPNVPASIIDPVNRGFQSLFVQLQKTAGYNLSFQASDMGLMLLAAREIVSLSHFIAKVMRYSLKGVAYNAAYPAMSVELLGIDHDDLIKNFNDYRGEMEALLPMMDVLPTPDLPLYYRAAQLFGSTWMDDVYPKRDYQYKCTRYHTRPLGFRFLSNISEDKTSSLAFVDTTDYTTLRQYIDLLKTCIIQILKRDDFKEIAGRLANFYGTSWSYRNVDFDNAQVAVHDEFTLAQIHNAIVPTIACESNTKEYISVDTDYTLDLDYITDAAGLIQGKSEITIFSAGGASAPAAAYILGSNLVDLSSAIPVSAGAVIDATRLMNKVHLLEVAPIKYVSEADSTDYLYLQPANWAVAWDAMCNPEYLVGVTNDDESISFEIVKEELNAYDGFAGLTLAIGNTALSDAISNPRCIAYSGNTGTHQALRYRWIIDNHMVLPDSSFAAMNRMASLSIMGVTKFFNS